MYKEDQKERNKVGKFKIFGIMLLGLYGLIVGYGVGSDLVDFAQSRPQIADVMTYLVDRYPVFVKFIFTVSFAGFFGRLGSLLDILDEIFEGGTRKKRAPKTKGFSEDPTGDYGTNQNSTKQ